MSPSAPASRCGGLLAVLEHGEVVGPALDLHAQLAHAAGHLGVLVWRGVVMTPKTVAEIERLRRDGGVANTGEHGQDLAA